MERLGGGEHGNQVIDDEATHNRGPGGAAVSGTARNASVGGDNESAVNVEANTRPAVLLGVAGQFGDRTQGCFPIGGESVAARSRAESPRLECGASRPSAAPAWSPTWSRQLRVRASERPDGRTSARATPRRRCRMRRPHNAGACSAPSSNSLRASAYGGCRA
uniref:Putative transcription regulator n=1 Tax=Streptomyces albus subsp. albus TaxID=67257 RepID=W5QK60_9ACTN|nr:putative transcription regulator [Streptomyces albus subsp. albus]